MTLEQKIARINELYKKSKSSEGLTEAEKSEQALLRKEYIDNVRQNLRNQLNNINIQNEDGSIENLGERYGSKKRAVTEHSENRTGNSFRKRAVSIKAGKSQKI